MKHRALPLALLGAVSLGAGAAQIETFVPPKLKEVRNPKYPDDLRMKGREGWVTVNYIVSSEGKPYDTPSPAPPVSGDLSEPHGPR